MFGRRRRTPPSSSPQPEPEDPDPVAAVLDERLSVVEHDLTSAAGNASLCAISKSGGEVDGAKYLEGRMAALMELRRRLARGGGTGDVLASMRATWSHELDAARDRDAGRGWIAYRAGGVDELAELTTRI